jgi:chromosome segregation ATPase
MSDNDQMKLRIDQLLEAESHLVNDNNDKQHQIVNMLTDMEALQVQLARADEEVSRLQPIEDQLVGLTSQYQLVCADLEKFQGADSEVARLNYELQIVMQQVDELNRALMMEQSANAELQRNVMRSNLRKEELERDVTNQVQVINELKKEIAQMNSSVRDFSNALAYSSIASPSTASPVSSAKGMVNGRVPPPVPSPASYRAGNVNYCGIASASKQLPPTPPSRKYTVG